MGLADFIGLGGEVDIAALTADLRADKPKMDPKRFGLQARCRLLVEFFLDHEGWSVDRLRLGPDAGGSRDDAAGGRS